MRIVIAEGHDRVRARLVVLVKESVGCELVGEASEIAAAEDLIARLRPDVLLIGVRLSDAGGFDLLRRTRQREWKMRTILLCARLDGHYLHSAIALGATFALEFPRDLDYLPALLRLEMKRLEENSGPVLEEITA